MRQGIIDYAIYHLHFIYQSGFFSRRTNAMKNQVQVQGFHVWPVREVCQNTMGGDICFKLRSAHERTAYTKEETFRIGEGRWNLVNARGLS